MSDLGIKMNAADLTSIIDDHPDLAEQILDEYFDNYGGSFSIGVSLDPADIESCIILLSIDANVPESRKNFRIDGISIPVVIRGAFKNPEALLDGFTDFKRLSSV